MQTTTVLIAHSQELTRDSLTVLLNRDPSTEVVATIADGKSAISMARLLQPRAAILEVDLPGIDGLQVARQIRVDTPGIGIVMLSAHGRAEHLREFMKDDSSGKAFLLKSALNSIGELVRTIEDVSAGRTVLDPSMVSKLTTDRVAKVGGSLRALSPREAQVLGLMAKAYGNRAIAGELFIQTRTVEHHISSILAKLGFNASGGRHGRVHAVLTYLGAIGQLPVNTDAPDGPWGRFAA